MSMLLDVYRRSLTHGPSHPETSSFVDEIEKLNEEDRRLVCTEYELLFDLTFIDKLPMNEDSIIRFDEEIKEAMMKEFGRY